MTIFQGGVIGRDASHIPYARIQKHKRTLTLLLQD